MSGFTYSIIVSDTDPLTGTPGNFLEFKESSYRKAHKRMEDAMSRGYFVSCCRTSIPYAWEHVPEEEPPAAKHTRKKK